jgi:hypothetical protein
VQQPAKDGPRAPTGLFESEQDIDARAAEIREFQKWAYRNWDGYEGGKDSPSYTAEQIRERMLELEQELTDALPKARAALADRQRFEQTVVTQAYPNLLKAGTPEAAIADAIMAQVPGLKAWPYARVLIGDALAGEKLRLQAAKPAAAPAAPPPKPPPAAPRLAIDAAPARPTHETHVKPGSGVNVKKLVSAGATQDALAEQLMNE